MNFFIIQNFLKTFSNFSVYFFSELSTIVGYRVI